MGRFTKVLMPLSIRAQKKYQVKKFRLRSIHPSVRKEIPQTDLDKEIFDEDWYPRHTWDVTRGVDFDGADSWIFTRKDDPSIKYDELQLEFHRGGFVGWLRDGAKKGGYQRFDRQMISDMPTMKREMAFQKSQNRTPKRTTAEALQLLLSYGFVPKKVGGQIKFVPSNPANQNSNFRLDSKDSHCQEPSPGFTKPREPSVSSLAFNDPSPGFRKPRDLSAPNFVFTKP